jgi:hypothetical protein
MYSDSGSYKRLTVRDYHSIMYRVSDSYKRLTVRDYHSIMYRASGSYKRLTVRDYHSTMFFIMFFSETAKKLKANLAGIFINR